jgi:methionyl-tRNA synthetase
VTYVWFDALVNYISALEYLPPTPSLDRYWPATIHLVGKDILTTHAVYWSTILMALELPLPETIFAHGWWTVNGEKMSKSRGNVVDPHAIIDEFGADAFRYFLLREIPFGQDGDFSREALISRINTDLANDLGNLLNRTLTMIERFANGTVPEPGHVAQTDVDKLLQQTARQLLSEIDTHLGNLAFNQALEAIWGLIKLGNQYLEKSAPWTLAKNPAAKPRLTTVLYHAAETLRFLCLTLYPFMPQAAEEMKRQLGLLVNFSKPLLAGDITWGGVLPGTHIAKGHPLFPRIDTSPKASPSAQPHTGMPDLISIEDFKKIDLRVGVVRAAERVPKSSKLLKLHVDLGAEQRQIVAGIGTKYAPDDLLGKQVVIVANLKPVKLMGIESQGMVLAAGEEEVLSLLMTLEDVAPGSKIK